MNREELFQAVLCKALTFLEVFLDRYGKQIHGSLHQFRQQAIDIDVSVFSLSPLSLTVWTLQGACCIGDSLDSALDLFVRI